MSEIRRPIVHTLYSDRIGGCLRRAHLLIYVRRMLTLRYYVQDTHYDHHSCGGRFGQ